RALEEIAASKIHPHVDESHF
ncbi:DNA-directed RNA polymerase subunit omega, partial [Staphylococcus pseudintermedius]